MTVWLGVCLALGCGSDGPSSSGSGSTGGSDGSTTTASSTAPPATSGSTTTASSSSTEADPDGSSSSSSTTEDGSSSTTDAEPQSFLAGFDVADISPNEGHLALNVYMGSYGAPFVRGPAEGVHDSVFVRSFAIELGDEGFVAAVADLPGMGNSFTRSIRARVSEQLGLPEDHIIIANTHTHSGPDFQGLWGGGPSEYRNPVIDDIVGSMNRAWVNREPADLEVASTVAPNNNRRDWEFTDDSLTVLVARDPEGEMLGSVGVFAAHPTILGESNKLISRDWCGGFVDTMEEHTGAPSVLFNGVLGDASVAVPDGEYADGFERAEAYGALIADIAYEAVGETEPVSLELHLDGQEWTLPVNNGLFQIAAALGLLDYDFDDDGGGQSVVTGATYIRLGTQLQIVSFPGEPLTRTGLEIKDAMTAPHQAVLGQAGDSLGYFILGDEWMTGRNDDYEETVALHETAGDSAVEVIRALVGLDAF